MSRNVHRLKAVELPKLAKTEGMHCDGAGLYLSVKPPAASWVYRYMVNKRARSMGLGPFPEFPLAEARQRAQEARSQVARGRRPPRGARRTGGLRTRRRDVQDGSGGIHQIAPGRLAQRRS